MELFTWRTCGENTMVFGLVWVAWLIVSLYCYQLLVLQEKQRRYIHFGECKPFLIAVSLKWIPRTRGFLWKSRNIPYKPVTAQHTHETKWTRQCTTGTKWILMGQFGSISVRVKREQVWEPLPYFSSWNGRGLWNCEMLLARFSHVPLFLYIHVVMETYLRNACPRERLCLCLLS